MSERIDENVDLVDKPGSTVISAEAVKSTGMRPVSELTNRIVQTMVTALTSLEDSQLDRIRAQFEAGKFVTEIGASNFDCTIVPEVTVFEIKLGDDYYITPSAGIRVHTRMHRDGSLRRKPLVIDLSGAKLHLPSLRVHRSKDKSVDPEMTENLFQAIRLATKQLGRSAAVDKEIDLSSFIK